MRRCSLVQRIPFDAPSSVQVKEKEQHTNRCHYQIEDHERNEKKTEMPFQNKDNEWAQSAPAERCVDDDDDDGCSGIVLIFPLSNA